MLRIFKILRQHGRQSIPDLRNVILPAIFRGRPVITDGITSEEASLLKTLCPVAAIDHRSKLTIDLGKCLFCKECEFALPDKIKFSNDYRIATNSREKLIIEEGTTQSVAIEDNKVREVIRKVFKKSLKLRQVSAGGENSCEMELNAAGNVNFDMGRFGIEFVASPRHADGLVLTGPLSSNMAEALELTWAAMPSPKLLILVGTDAISGGLFKDSPSVNRSFLDHHQPDLFVPGNPPHPLTFINGILNLLGK